MLICPECEGETFTATLATRTTYTYTVDESGHLHERYSEVVDRGDKGDIEFVTCEDCYVEIPLDSLVNPSENHVLDCGCWVPDEGTGYCECGTYQYGPEGELPT